MLAHTIRSNLMDLRNLNARTKATKFSSLFSSAPTAKNTVEVRHILKRDKVVKTNIDENDELYNELFNVTPEEIAEYIVENPDEIIINFPINANGKSGLPFFKSVNQKLFGKQKIVSI